MIAKNFHLDPEVFKHVPENEKYIFQGTIPGSIDDERPNGKGAKKSKLQFSHKMLAQEPKVTTGGEVRISCKLNTSPPPLPSSHTLVVADEWSLIQSLIAGSHRRLDQLPHLKDNRVGTRHH